MTASSQSAARTVTSGDAGLFNETFKPKNAHVVPGEQHVIIATLDQAGPFGSLHCRGGVC